MLNKNGDIEGCTRELVQDLHIPITKMTSKPILFSEICPKFRKNIAKVIARVVDCTAYEIAKKLGLNPLQTLLESKSPEFKRYTDIIV